MTDNNNESLLELAQRAYREDRLEDAERACRGALDLDPEEFRALTLLGGILLRRDDNGEAVRVLSQATEHRPGDSTALLWLSEALLRLARPGQAAEVLQKALTLEPDNMMLLKMAGRAFMAYGDIGRAGECFHRCLQQEKDHPPALLGLGICFYRDGLYRQAIETLERFLEFEPDNLSGRLHLANSLLHNGHFSAAEDGFQRLAGIPGGQEAALQGLVATAVELVQPELARERLVQFEAAGGDSVRAAAMRARLASMTGEDDVARQNLRFILKRQPEHLDAWVQLVSMGPEYVDDNEVEVLMALAGKLAGKRRAQGLFALARVHEYRQDREREVAVLHKANQARAMGHQVQREQELAVFEAMRNVCDEAWLDSLPACPEGDLRPVFICGMPRSGTTLTEQILSSHPGVTAVGESHASYHALMHAGSVLGEEKLVAVLHKDPQRLPALIREGYREFLARRHGLEEGVFTDKSMWLLPYLPLLYKAFPNAIFIHVHRHPLDVTFGCYKQLFTNGQEFSYTVQGCAAYYARSEALMADYQALLPDVIHDFSYEALVADQEAASRRLLEWTGLPWDDGVLAFHKNRRAVSTASARQVRKGLYTGAAGRWRHYGSLLEPFRQALEREGVVLREPNSEDVEVSP